MRILIAEDEAVSRMALVRQLKAWGHEVAAAEDGQAGWEAFAAGEFDIVITDWEMPRLSGPEFVARIRGEARAIYTYVIILTSRSDKSDVVKGIEAGADDYVSKPFDREELRVRLLAGERIVRLERALSSQNAALRAANDHIRSGLQAAARVQQSLLPHRPILSPHVRTAWRYVPTDELAGDAVGLHLIDDRYLVAYVLDVSGHGVPAALLAVSAMNALAPIPAEVSLLRDAVDGGGHRPVRAPARVAAELNRRFRAGEYDGRYMTMILCVLDTHAGQLHVTSAGHPPPIVLRGGERVEVPDAGGFPIAIMDVADYDDCTVQLNPGDRVCLFSDGILEQRGPGDCELFGADRLLRSLTARRHDDPARAAAGLVEDLVAWAGHASFADDVSVVITDWAGP
jgi:sigma-B regulation protein RsbU (phosphoserine phosphatase)